jgi:hypothetical protein
MSPNTTRTSKFETANLQRSQGGTKPSKAGGKNSKTSNHAVQANDFPGLEPKQDIDEISNLFYGLDLDEKQKKNKKTTKTEANPGSLWYVRSGPECIWCGANLKKVPPCDCTECELPN